MDFFKIRGDLASIRYPCMAEIKYDGMPVRVQYTKGRPLFLTTEAGLEYVFDKDIFTGNPGHSGTFLAEWIYGQGKNNDIYKLTSTIRRDLTSPDKDSLSLRIFDILTLNEIDHRQQPLRARINVIKYVIKPEFQAKSWTINNPAELLAHSRNVYEDGFEGLVIKNLHESFHCQTWVKLKPPSYATAPVIRVDLARFEVSYHGITIGLKKTFAVNVGDIVEIKHYGIQPSGSLRNPIVVKKV